MCLKLLFMIMMIDAQIFKHFLSTTCMPWVHQRLSLSQCCMGKYSHQEMKMCDFGNCNNKRIKIHFKM